MGSEKSKRKGKRKKSLRKKVLEKTFKSSYVFKSKAELKKKEDSEPAKKESEVHFKTLSVFYAEEPQARGIILVPLNTSLKKARNYISDLDNPPTSYKFTVDGIVITPKQEGKIKCGSFDSIFLRPIKRRSAPASESSSVVGGSTYSGDSSISHHLRHSGRITSSANETTTTTDVAFSIVTRSNSIVNDSPFKQKLPSASSPSTSVDRNATASASSTSQVGMVTRKKSSNIAIGSNNNSPPPPPPPMPLPSHTISHASTATNTKINTNTNSSSSTAAARDSNSGITVKLKSPWIQPTRREVKTRQSVVKIS
eukprot:Nk52_evm5s490 gene=Nk52_evmTU5s490